MAIYHLNGKIFGRGDGVSIIARAAYRSGTRLRDPETGKSYSYTRKSEVVHSEISLCPHAPTAYLDRQTLWSSVQKAERNRNAQLAREIEVALPREFSREQQITVLREYIKKHFTSAGMICDWSIHDKKGNPHAHLLLTLRPLKEDGSWGPKKRGIYEIDAATGERIPVINQRSGEQKKDSRGRLQWKRRTIPSTDWNSPEAFARWRAGWADACNRELERMGAPLISEKSHKERGISQEATIHEGYLARAIEARGGVSDRCETNREIRRKNGLLDAIRTRLRTIQTELRLAALRNQTLKKLLDIAGDKENHPQDISR